jgi:hypothetical protein
MRSVWKAAGLAALVGLAMVVMAPRVRAKPASAFELLTGFSAKETCSCVFVVEQTDDVCKEFGSLEGSELDIQIDRAAKSVSTKLLTSKRVARFVDGQGCQLDPLP